MIRIVDKMMYLAQGDTATVEFTPEFLGLSVDASDRLLFLLTSESTELYREILAPDENGVFTLHLADTQDIPVGEYRWQVRQYTNAVVEDGNVTGDEVNTPFGPQSFKVMEVLGDGIVYT